MDSTTLNVLFLPGRPSVHRAGRLVGRPIDRPADCGLAPVADLASRQVGLRRQLVVVLDLFLCRLPFLFLLFLNQMKLDWASGILSPGSIANQSSCRGDSVSFALIWIRDFENERMKPRNPYT